MQPISIITHLLRALRQAIGRVLLWFFITGVVSALVVETVAFLETGHRFPPTQLADIAAIALGVAVGYAAALTVLVGEVVHIMITTVQSSERDLAHEMAGGMKVVESFAQSFEHPGNKK